MTHEEQPHDDIEPTIQEEEIIEEMNATDMRHGPETYFKTEMSDVTNTKQGPDTNNQGGNQKDPDDETGNTTAHGYNLWPRPTKEHKKLNLRQVA